MGTLKLLALNPGSSSVKATLFEGDDLKAIRTWKESVSPQEAPAKIEQIIKDAGPLDMVGVRIVDGGPDLTRPTLIDDNALELLERAASLTPLHSGEAIGAIKACKSSNPAVPVVAAFDTTFHLTIPRVANSYPLPKELVERKKIKRMGFHGLAYASVVLALEKCRDGLPERLVACHLGSGSSACAMVNGASVDTTMGFTPLEGLMMGTRSGSVDPGLLIYLLQNGTSVEELSELLNKKSGLLGVSSLSSDVRKLESSSETDARFALDLFARIAAKHIASLAVSLGGIDALCFSGGIGENSASVRERIVASLEFLGFHLDAEANASKADLPRPIHVPNTKEIWVVPANEDLEVARAAQSERPR